jgi:hypothetical protein
VFRKEEQHGWSEYEWGLLKNPQRWSVSLSPLPPMSSSSSTALILGGRGDV